VSIPPVFSFPPDRRESALSDLPAWIRGTVSTKRQPMVHYLTSQVSVAMASGNCRNAGYPLCTMFQQCARLPFFCLVGF
jgi:hypothetical protein